MNDKRAIKTIENAEIKPKDMEYKVNSILMMDKALKNVCI
jgi:hypothetical protein